MNLIRKAKQTEEGQKSGTASFRINRTKMKHGGYSAALIVMVLVILVVVNLLAGQLPSKYIKIDTSDNSYYSIGDTTKQILEGLSEDVNIYVLVAEDRKDTVLDEMLTRYQELSSHVKVQYVDPAANPGFLSQYDASSASSNSLVVTSSKRNTLVDFGEIYVTDMDYAAYYSTGQQSYTTSYDGENQVTSAIDFVVSDTLPVLYTLTGHGESELASDVTTAVNQHNMEIKELNLLTEAAIPEDASVILINQPTKDLSQEEQSALKAYLEGGGSLMCIPKLSTEGEMTNFDGLLASYGMTLGKAAVLESDSAHYYQLPYYVLPDIESSEITSPLQEANISMLLIGAQDISASEDARDSLTLTPLLTTTDGSYAKKVENGSLSTVEKEDGDAQGPFHLGMLAEEKLDEETTSRVVVISCEALLDSSILSSLPVGNLDLFLNSLSYLGGHESTISISAKEMGNSSLVVPASVAHIMTAVTMVLIPLGLLLTGFVVWFRRRAR